MTPYWADDQVSLYAGDCLDVLRDLPDCSIDAVVTDPPYGLGFMGHQWDQPGDYGALRGNGVRQPMHPRDRANGRTNTAAAVGSYDLSAPANAVFGRWCQAWATECLRVLKPGGHLLAFGGTRTWHRLTCAIEDAGFEIRDSIAWLYGSGFPKSLDVSKAIDKAAGAERDDLGESQTHHGGGTNHVYAQDEWTRENFARKSRLTAPATTDARTWQGWGTALKPAHEPIVVARKPLTGTVAQTVLAHGTGALNVDACRVGMSADDSERLTTWHAKYGGTKYADGDLYGKDRGDIQPPHDAGRWPPNVLLDGDTADALDEQSGTTTSTDRPRHNTAAAHNGTSSMGKSSADWTTTGHADTGGASRFFPTFRYEAKAPTSERPRDGAGAHPTVKPLDLMRWLVRLVTPPGGLVLDPFAGSGTTGEACVLEHFRCVLIEREVDYLPLIKARLGKPLAVEFDFGAVS